jgi:prepilin-type N-terminal cleavage/methylation domain-containing protein
MIGSMRQIRDDERGMTLIELMVSIGIGSVILTAALTMFLTGMGGAASVQDRADAAQRARLGFDRVTALVGAQVCNGVGTPGAPIVSGDKDKVFFTANTDKADDKATGYELRYVPATQSLWEYRYPLSDTENVAGYRAWAPNPTSSRQLLERAVPAAGVNVFRYYGTDNPGTGAPVEFSPGGGPLSGADKPRVLRIDLSLRVLPTRTQSIDDKPGTLMQSQSYVNSNVVNGSLDEGPKC